MTDFQENLATKKLRRPVLNWLEGLQNVQIKTTVHVKGCRVPRELKVSFVIHKQIKCSREG